jgi:integrase/recombinase XerD
MHVLGDVLAIDSIGRASRNTAVPLLHPEDQVVQEMFDGWRNQQLSRNLSFQTIQQRERLVRRFLEATNEHPWNWTSSHVDEFFGDQRSVHQNTQSTLRSYQNALRLFCDYLTDPGYEWTRICLELFGTHPTQVCFEWNTATHVQESERGPGKRAFTKAEVQSLFDRADDEADRIARHHRKGWLPSFRDSTIFKIAYSYGLRRNEVRHLETFDFSRNPQAPEFGNFGVLNVRFGKAMKGSAHKQRSVLTVFDWTEEVIEEWNERGRSLMTDGQDMFPNERQGIVSEAALGARFRRYRDDLGLSPGLDFHSLRRSYVTHLIEDGWDALFVQRQVGHEYASTTGLYTSVSSDYRTKTLRRVLDSTINEALGRKQKPPDETHR